MAWLGFWAGCLVLAGILAAMLCLLYWNKSKVEGWLSHPGLERAVEKVDRYFNWRSARELIENKIFHRLPIVIIFLPLFVTAFEKLPVWMTWLPPKSLYLPYVAAWLVVFSKVLYLLFCPPFEKRYRIIGQFLEDGGTVQRMRRDVSDYLVWYFSGSILLGERPPTQGTMRHRRLLGLMLQYRIVAEDFSFEGRSVEEMRDLAKEIANFQPKRDKNGCYVLEGNGGNKVTLSEEQLIRHLFDDFTEFQRFTMPVVRLTIAGLLLVAGLFALFPALIGLRTVLSQF